MRAIILNKVAKKEILRVKEYANAHRIGRNELIRMMEYRAKAVGDTPEYYCIINEDVKVVYSIEDQPVGLCGHLSVSASEGLPSTLSVELLMEELGLKGDLHDCVNVWMEEDIVTASGKKGTAINVLQLLEEAL